ncbi:MAG: class I tRNA ligase family protein, partial [Gemmataceae bacterium]
QWFVRMGELKTERSEPKDEPEALATEKTSVANASGSYRPGLARMAMDAVTDGRVKFFPARYADTYLDWLSEKRDWCNSRQLWWGHRIPVWTKRIPGYGTDFPEEQNKGSEESRRMIAKLLADSRAAQSSSLEKKYPGLVKEHASIDPKSMDTIIHVCLAEPRPAIEKELEAEGYTQDPDVLDTWFSSALWPHSTFGWPEMTPELKYYYPTSTLVTSRDIITLWVARMVMTGLYNLGDVPFRHVYITPKLLDGFGEGMSKSKGNGVDPLDIIEKYGTDALRFQMSFIAGETQDSRMPVANICPHCGELVPVKQEHMYMRTKRLACPKCKQAFRPGGPWPSEDPELPTAKQASDKFEMGRNFANKLWNAARLVLLNLDGYRPEAIRYDQLPTEDRWILSRLSAVTKQVTEALEAYHFSDVTRTLYDFTWSEFCDWYLEMSKGRLKDEAARPLVQRVLVGVLDAILRLIHPVMPFVSESLWQALNEAAFERGLPTPEASAESVMIAPWPAFPADWENACEGQWIAKMQELVHGIREIRNNFMVNDKEALNVTVRCPEELAASFRVLQPFISQLAGVGTFACGPDVAKPPQAASRVLAGFDLFVSLAGLIDPAKEKGRLEKQLAEKRKLLQSKQGKLANEGFVARAPAEVVEQERAAVAELQQQIAALEENLRDLIS